jgi:hypothetical protein
VLLALAQRPRRTLLVVELVAAVIVAGAIILPIQLSFAAILAIGGPAARLPVRGGCLDPGGLAVNLQDKEDLDAST